MKKRAWMTALAAALAVLLAACGALCGAVYSAAVDETLYGDQSRAAVAQTLGNAQDAAVTAYIGLDAQEQREAAREIALYMADADAGETLDLPILNEREKAHMADVRGIMRTCEGARTVCMSLSAALAVICAWTGAGAPRRHRRVWTGALAGAGLLAALGMALALAMRSAGFGALFVRMHEWIFSNDLWLLNPDTDILIRMMPQLLFEWVLADVLKRAAGVFALALALLVAVYAVVSGMIDRHVTEGKQA